MSDTRAAFDQLTKAINAHDFDNIVGQYHPEATVSGPDGSFTGREEIRTYFQEFQEAFPDLHINVWSKITSGDLASDEWVLSGTNTGPLRLPDGTVLDPTGAAVQVRGCDVAAVENGQVVSHRVYFDQASVMEQLGLTS
jgi:limonene-1,2-epoxide hydrolase